MVRHDDQGKPRQASLAPAMTPAELDRFLDRLEVRLDQRIAERLTRTPAAVPGSQPGSFRRMVLAAGAGVAGVVMLAGLAAGAVASDSDTGPVFDRERPVIMLDRREPEWRRQHPLPPAPLVPPAPAPALSPPPTP